MTTKYPVTAAQVDEVRTKLQALLGVQGFDIRRISPRVLMVSGNGVQLPLDFAQRDQNAEAVAIPFDVDAFVREVLIAVGQAVARRGAETISQAAKARHATDRVLGSRGWGGGPKGHA